MPCEWIIIPLNNRRFLHLVLKIIARTKQLSREFEQSTIRKEFQCNKAKSSPIRTDLKPETLNGDFKNLRFRAISSPRAQNQARFQIAQQEKHHITPNFRSTAKLGADSATSSKREYFHGGSTEYTLSSAIIVTGGGAADSTNCCCSSRESHCCCSSLASYCDDADEVEVQGGPPAAKPCGQLIPQNTPLPITPAGGYERKFALKGG